MIAPAGVKIHLALGRTDMRKGFDSLAVLVQEVLKKDPFSGHLFAFRGKKADTMKILFWDGNGLCLRESYRDGGKIKKRTIANLSDWPTEIVEGASIIWCPADRSTGLCGPAGFIGMMTRTAAR